MTRFKYAIIDLDIPVYKNAAGGQKTFYHLYNEHGELLESFPSAKDCKAFVEDARDFMEQDVSGWTRESSVEIYEFEDCAKALDSMIARYIKKADAEQGKFSIGGSGENFRDKIGKIEVYKGKRKSERPHHYKRLKEYAIEKYNPKIVLGMESDDQISMWLYEDYLKGLKSKDKSKCNSIMVDLEKDCRTCPGFHIHPEKDDEPVWISTLEADKWCLTMALGGDNVDCYSGARGYGYVKAAKALEGCTTNAEMWQRSLEVFLKVYGEGIVIEKTCTGDPIEMTAEDMLIENARLAFMLRTGDTENDWKVLRGD